MAFAIANYALNPDPSQISQGKRQTYADQTGTTTVTTGGQGDLLSLTFRNFKATIYLKSFTHGTGTVGPIFALQVADNQAFSTNVRTVAIEQAFAVGATGDQACLYIVGVAPDGPKQFVRILVTFSGTDSGTFDAVVDAS